MDQKQKRKDYIKQWVKNNPELVKARAQRWRDKNREEINAKRRFKEYGITPEIFEELKVKQNNSCAICNTNKLSKNRDELDIDHCHTTNKVRGLLCNSCNRGLGYFKDNPEALLNAIKYLKEFNERI